jgi:hypothetical protein
MPIQVYPVAVTSSSSTSADAITCVSAGTMYEGIKTYEPAVYSITCVSTTVAVLEFYSNTYTPITSVTTSLGTASVNLASTADRFRVYTDTGSNIVVTITKTASAVSNTFSGTLDTITSSGTYNQTSTSGYAYTVVVGGGGGGARGPEGVGGGSGGVGAKLIQLTGSMPVTIGAQGTGAAGPGNSGGTTTFAGITANGGSGSGTGGSVTGATYSSNANYGQSTTKIFGHVKNGTTGGGAGQPRVRGGDGVIGQGGNFGDNPQPATGYGAGGGGGQYSNLQGSAGSPGVVYVLRY